ncbi:MAG TPA: ABC-type transport auxiliary lipoprotein family protein [Burkholderiales bacterium]|nr:ABC-type transport auxiliary lipoprotein family protein [Burkholderiales bacterium]
MNRAARWAASLAASLACGCAALNPTSAPHPNIHSLDRVAAELPAPAPAAGTAPTLVVSPPGAAAGFDSQRILYVRKAHTLEYFAHNEWVDTPARMLAPLIVAATARSGAFGAVVLTPSIASGELRLDTQVRRLQHEFLGNPSRVRFTLHATLLDTATREVVATREFEAVATAPSEDPYGGVVAANEAVRSVLASLAEFCADAARNWRPRSKPAA